MPYVLHFLQTHPQWQKYDGAMAEKLGNGLQNRPHRCDSGSRLQIANERKMRRDDEIGKHNGLKIRRSQDLEGSSPSPGTE